jgi:hypothetical protein
MDIQQMLWGLNSVLLILLGFFVRMWISGIRDDIASIKRDLREKAEEETCRRTHEAVDKLLHRHAMTGSSGEAVYTK